MANLFANVILGNETIGCIFVLDSIELNPLAIGEDTCDNLITNVDFSSGANNCFRYQ